MSYDVSKLTTTDECDQLISMAQDTQSDLQFAQTSLTRKSDFRLRSAAKLAATLATVVAQIDAFSAARDAMPPGPDKDTIISRLRRLNDRMENLEESRNRAGAVALLEIEMDISFINGQLDVIGDFMEAVQQRKDELTSGG